LPILLHQRDCTAPQYWKNLQDSMATPVKEGYQPQATRRGHPLVRHRSHRSQSDRRDARAEGDLSVGRGIAGGLQHAAPDDARDGADGAGRLRGRALVGGNMDVYQWFLMISTHSQRHILQIREIKAHAAYPRS
jgi:hypothetical protein